MMREGVARQWESLGFDKKGRMTYACQKEKKKSAEKRTCGICGEKKPQNEMIRTDCSDTGYICYECDRDLHPEYDIDEW